MQTASFKIWNLWAEFNSYNDNRLITIIFKNFDRTVQKYS